MKIPIKINNEQEIMNFVNLMNTFNSPIDLSKGNHIVDAKSILGVIALGIYDEIFVNLLSANEDEMVRFNNEIKIWKK